MLIEEACGGAFRELMVLHLSTQGLPQPSTAGGSGSILGWAIDIPHATWLNKRPNTFLNLDGGAEVFTCVSIHYNVYFMCLSYMQCILYGNSKERRRKESRQEKKKGKMGGRKDGREGKRRKEVRKAENESDQRQKHRSCRAA